MNEDSNAGSRSIRVLDVLDAVSEMDRPASAADIEAASGLPKATVHRLCNLLMDEGYLRRDINGRGFELGERFMTLAMQSFRNHGARAERHAILEAAARDIGETCNIAVPTMTSMLYLDRVESEWPLRIQLPTGSQVPLHCTASGKLYLSTLSRSRRERLIDKLDLSARAANTITDRDALLAAVAQIAESGVGTDNEEFIPGMVAVAVGIRDADGKLLATMATHGPVVRMTFDDALAHVPRLQAAAEEVSKSLE